MEWTEVLDLSQDDQATVMVGLIAREAVMLETELRDAYVELIAGEEQLRWNASRQFSTLQAMCLEAVESATCLDANDREHARGALEHAKSVYESRNRFVHDQLFALSADGWTRVELHAKGSERPPRALVGVQSLRDCYIGLCGAGWRVSGIGLVARWMRADPSPEREAQLKRARIVLRGEFDAHWGATISYSS